MKKLRDMVEAKISVEKKGEMVTVHHGLVTSYPLHPEHQKAIAKLRPGMKTTFKDETGHNVHAHREGDTVHLHRPRTSNTLTPVPYHHFEESTSMELPVNADGENAPSNNAKRKKQDATQKMAGLMQRKQKDVVEQTNPYLIEENLIIEGYSEEDIAKGGTVIYRHEGRHYMSKVSHKTGGGAATKIHTTSKLGHVVPLNRVVSTDASDWNKFKNSNVNEEMSKDDRSSVALKALVAKKNLKQSEGRNKSQEFLNKMVSKVNAGNRMKAEATSTDNLKKQWDSHKDEERPSPMFAAHLKKVAKEIAKRNKQKNVKEGVDIGEAFKINTKVTVHAPGKSYHGIEGRVGEIRNGAFKGAPKTYTVHHGEEGAIQLKKEQLKALKEGSMYTDPSVDKEMKATKKEYEHKAKHYEAKKVGDITTAEKEQRRMKKFQSIRNAINQSRPKTSYGPTKNSDIKPGNRRMD